MKRQYLEEDLHLITKYFPGAKTVALRTPFDLTVPANRAVLLADNQTDPDATDNWYGGVLWTRS